MKSKLQVQYNNKNVDATEIEKVVKANIKEQGVKINTIDTLEIYYKPEDASVYYVVTTKDNEVIGNNEPLYVE